MDASNILLIDASEKHRSVLRRFFQQALPDASLLEIDPTTTSLENSELEWEDDDLLIIDNQMGNLDGLQWVESHLARTSLPPVIFLSSMSNPASEQARQSMARGLKLGAQSFMFKKQLNSKLLHQQVKSALERRAKERTQNCGRVTTFEEHKPDTPNTDPTQPLALKSTFYQMQHAKALLHGHDAWPFPVKDLLAGKAQFAGYDFKEYMGRRNGIYSFMGNRTGSNETLALKLIDRAVTHGEPLSEKLEQDLELLKGIEHPGIVKWHDYHYIDGHLLMAQEYIEGQQLSHKLKRTGVTEEQAIDYSLQILSAIDCLHRHGLYAGEFAPDNLLFRNNDTLALTHLNNTYYELGDADSSTTMHVYKDTLYLSPEILQGMSVDHRSDFYIAGTIIFHLLAGAPPYHGKTMKDVITEHIASPVPHLPDEKHRMNVVIQNLLRKTPSQRYQKAEDIIEHINRLYA